jgi:hypothetical protein
VKIYNSVLADSVFHITPEENFSGARSGKLGGHARKLLLPVQILRQIRKKQSVRWSMRRSQRKRPQWILLEH